MVYFKSAEVLNPETISQEERKQIVNLRYEDYFKKSCEDLDTVQEINLQFPKIIDIYSQTARLLKREYKEASTEELAQSTENKFFNNIKNLFIRIWSAIVSVYEKISSIIVNMIKALIIFIKRQNLLKNSLWAKLKNDKKGLNFTEPSDELVKNIQKMLDGKYKIRTIEYPGNRYANFSDIHNCISNNFRLKPFVMTPIIVNNKKSSINSENLKKLYQTLETVATTDDAECVEKIGAMESEIMESTFLHMMYGETSDQRYVNENVNKFQTELADEYAESGSVKRVANVISFGEPVVNYIHVDLKHFLQLEGVQDPLITLEKLRFFLAQYERDANLVIGTGGYLDILSNVLKRYKSVAVEDNKIFKELKTKITTNIKIIGNDPANNSITRRMKRFTNLSISVQKMKTNFITLRQGVISNLLIAFSSENQALIKIFIPTQIKEDDDSSNMINEKQGNLTLAGDDRFDDD